MRLTIEKAETRVAAVVRAALDCRVALLSVSIRKPSLDDVFIHYTGKAIRQDGVDDAAEKKGRRGPHGRR